MPDKPASPHSAANNAAGGCRSGESVAERRLFIPLDDTTLSRSIIQRLNEVTKSVKASSQRDHDLFRTVLR